MKHTGPRTSLTLLLRCILGKPVDEGALALQTLTKQLYLILSAAGGVIVNDIMYGANLTPPPPPGPMNCFGRYVSNALLASARPAY